MLCTNLNEQNTIMSAEALPQPVCKLRHPAKEAATGADRVSGDEVWKQDIPQPACRAFTPERIRPFWRTLSASSLMQSLLDSNIDEQASEEAEALDSSARDLDEADADDQDGVASGEGKPGAALSPEEWADLPPIFTFKPGKQTGICWHAIFEKLDFAAGEQDITGFARALSLLLPARAIRVRWRHIDMVGKVCRSSWLPPLSRLRTLRPVQSRVATLSELDFNLRV